VVLLGDEEVGALVRSGERSRFEPSEKWASLPAGERPILGQDFEEDPYAAHVGKERTGVPLWFEHLLPEAGSPLRIAVADAIGIAPSRSYPMLLALGEDLPGNVRVRPVTGDLSFQTVARRVREAQGSDSDDSLPLRVSLAGVQFKISARVGKRGVAVPGWDEEGDWIVKFADQGHQELPAIEFATMSWADASGITVPSIRLELISSIAGIERLSHVAGDYAFAIQRFDRNGELRTHQEDFAQVLRLATGAGKYTDTNIDTIVNVCAALTPTDVDELLARIAFCVVCGNDDAHAKNFALHYPAPSRPRLSPAYDLVATLAFPQYEKNSMALKLAGARSFGEVKLEQFGTLARAAGLDPDQAQATVRASVRGQLEAWPAIRDLATTPENLRTFIDTRLARLPLAREATR
jgi:serine/threonine-protein kinase HipA